MSIMFLCRMNDPIPTSQEENMLPIIKRSKNQSNEIHVLLKVCSLSTIP